MKLPHNHGTRTSEILDALPKKASFEEISASFAMLSDSTRLKIFWLLCHSEDCVLNIAAAMNMSSPAVSHHLKVLKQAKLIVSRKEGKEVFYRLADTEEADMLHKAVDSILQIKCPDEKGL